MSDELFYSQRELKGKPCPKCGRKGLHLAAHPHAYGWKDSSRATCRFCGTTFRKRLTVPEQEVTP